jgi:hypothetical protein
MTLQAVQRSASRMRTGNMKEALPSGLANRDLTAFLLLMAGIDDEGIYSTDTIIREEKVQHRGGPLRFWGSKALRSSNF